MYSTSASLVCRLPSRLSLSMLFRRSLPVATTLSQIKFRRVVLCKWVYGKLCFVLNRYGLTCNQLNLHTCRQGCHTRDGKCQGCYDRARGRAETQGQEQRMSLEILLNMCLGMSLYAAICFHVISAELQLIIHTHVIYMHICMYACMYVCMYVFMYVVDVCL